MGASLDRIAGRGGMMKRLRARLARISSPIVRGAVTGMLGGIAAAVLYALLSPLLVVLSSLVIGALEGSGAEALLGSLVLPFVASLFVLVFGVLPAMLLGMVGGALIGVGVMLGRGMVSLRAGILIGVAVALLLTGALTLGVVAFISEAGQGEPFAFWFWLGIPSLIAIIVAGGTGRFVAATQTNLHALSQPHIQRGDIGT